MNESSGHISYSELCRIDGIRADFVTAIVDYGIVTPATRTSNHDWLFETTSVYWIKKASRLHTDLEIDWLAVALVIDLLKQNAALTAENERLHRLLQRFVGETEQD